MSFAGDLLDQADHLARREAKRPKQASLRRAVSAAYYALFHRLVEDAARCLAPSVPGGLRDVVKRAFGHAEMKSVCRGLVQGDRTIARQRAAGVPQPRAQDIPAPTQGLLAFPLEAELVTVLRAFLKLQEARHLADYDMSGSWTRFDALDRIQTAREAFAAWRAVRSQPNAIVFMSALLLQRSWGR